MWLRHYSTQRLLVLCPVPYLTMNPSLQRQSRYPEKHSKKLGIAISVARRVRALERSVRIRVVRNIMVVKTM